MAHKITLGCHSRWEDVCPYCANKWRKQMRKRYHEGVVRMKEPSFITLTLKRADMVGADGKRGSWTLDDLWALRNRFFQILRKRTNSHTGRRYRIGAFCGVIEPPNHVHLIVDCDYLPQHEMSEIWHNITGDSFVVDVRRVHDRSRCSGYVTKYITKTKDWPFIESADRDHLRICQSHGLEKEPEGDRFSLCDCGLVAGLHPTYTSEYYDELEYDERTEGE